MIRDWFRSKRALIAECDGLHLVVADRNEEIDELIASQDRDKVKAQTTINEQATEIARLKQVYDRLFTEYCDLSTIAVAKDQKLTAVVAELTRLREDIRRAEKGDNLPSVTGPGMARLANQPKPWQEGGQ